MVRSTLITSRMASFYRVPSPEQSCAMVSRGTDANFAELSQERRSTMRSDTALIVVMVDFDDVNTENLAFDNDIGK